MLKFPAIKRLQLLVKKKQNILEGNVRKSGLQSFIGYENASLTRKPKLLVLGR